MNSIRRSCQSALLNSQPLRPLSNGSRRAFSQCSACYRGSLPQFLEPSTPELATLLSKLNSKILLPAHLNHDQQLLVYKQENKAKLESEPINITLGEVTLPLEHIDRNRDCPSKRKTFKEVVALAETPADWENVLRMVQGFYDAGLEITPDRKEKVIRCLGEAGMHHLILKALQRSGDTGIKIKNGDELLWMVLRQMRLKASAEWEKEETKKALSLVEQIMELMENKDHLGGQDVLPGDLRANPLVIALPLELAAVRAKKHTEGQDKDGKVAKYALRLMKALEQDRWVKTELPKELDALNAEKSFDALRAMWRLIPFWNALKTSAAVLGSDMPNAKEARKVAADIKRSLALVEQSFSEKTPTKRALHPLKKKPVNQTKLLSQDIERCEKL
ncbi:hypothetical protein BCR34DRAFT_595623 [Clohesyomyces aquaticus]|uniref:Uncharacterized protein n=1 Tax=Clohesyomyces aquaticus TaxID=1231657 RepID=A0A1Y2A9K7_9PLEO|nr:hypothetical protein BCR34DRAFT_595623 [Clohesyomyces aquaticus]